MTLGLIVSRKKHALANGVGFYTETFLSGLTDRFTKLRKIFSKINSKFRFVFQTSPPPYLEGSMLSVGQCKSRAGGWRPGTPPPTPPGTQPSSPQGTRQ